MAKLVIKRLLLAALALVLLLAIALAVNTWRQGSRQLQVAPLAPVAVDAKAAAESLAAAVRFKTASGLLDPQGQAEAFAGLREHLKQSYPLVHERLKLETVNRDTLVYTWTGSDPQARPIALLAHQDVVPIAPGTEALWKQPPWDGRIADDHVWGRGAWDNKGNLVSQLEAAELLLKSGFQPRRTVVLIFGHDEEIGGRRGALAVVELFKQRGVRFEAVLDEGLLVTMGILKGIEAPIALVGVSEKGYLSVQLSVQGTPGHSSMPPAPGQGAIGVLSAALAKLDANPMPGGISGIAGEMFSVLAPEMQGLQRVVLSNLWLTAPIVERTLSGSASTNALIRSTTALTVVRAGQVDNVLPGLAEAVVNFRLLPGDTDATVLAHIKRVVADERVQAKVMPGWGETSPVSSSTSPFYKAVERSVREVFPGTVVAPGLMLGGTDARHFAPIADDIYRFSPVRATADDLKRFHGTDERISIANFVEMIRFYHRLLQLAAGAEGAAAVASSK